MAMWVMHALPVKVFRCPPFAVVCEGEHENPAISEVQPVIWLSDTKNVWMADIHRQIVEVYGEGSRTKKGMCENSASFSKKTGQMCITRNEMSARTVQVGNFWSSCIQSYFPPGVYHTFLHPKKFFASQSLRSDQETKDFVHDWLKGLVVNLFDNGMLKLAPQYDEFLNSRGSYVE
jgi:hypothetical protein